MFFSINDQTRFSGKISYPYLLDIVKEDTTLGDE